MAAHAVDAVNGDDGHAVLAGFAEYALEIDGITVRKRHQGHAIGLGDLGPFLNGIVGVFIDDEQIFHRMWKNAAKEVGKKLTVFSKVDDFLARCTEFDPATPIYLDSNLGDGIRGESFAPQLRAQGFKEIYMVTGYSPFDFESIEEIKAVLDKTPPWS